MSRKKKMSILDIIREHVEETYDPADYEYEDEEEPDEYEWDDEDEDEDVKEDE